MRAFLEEGRSQYFVATPSEPTPTTGNWLRVTITIVVIAMILSLAGYGIRWLNESNKSSQKEYAAEAQAVTSMVKKFNAEREWREKLEEVDELYLADVQTALVRNDGRPVLLYVQIVDVFGSGDKTIASFHSREAQPPELRFNLESDPQQVKKIIDNRDTNFEYAVIASISSVERSPQTEDEDKEQFMASGRCLDLMPINY